jgi:ferrochelatase
MTTKRAVLLANLGSPDAPDEHSVRRYLNQFLMDPLVIQLPWLLRRMIVSLFVLPKRPKDSAEAYKSIWWEDGSPLVVLSRQLRDALQTKLDIPVFMSMRYGQPSIESAILEIQALGGIEEILFIPLYPHFADSTVQTSIEEARRCIKKHGLHINLNVQEAFYEQDDYINALVASSKEALEAEHDHILFSYHGLPEAHLKKADPTGNHCLSSSDCCEKPSIAHATCYRHQIFASTRAFVDKAGLEQGSYSVAFQSRLGRAKWLDPYTEESIRKLAQQGVKKLLVICPAFVTDCLETLEEIGLRGEEVFLEAGGESLTLVPCMNDHPLWVETLASWCETNGA